MQPKPDFEEVWKEMQRYLRESKRSDVGGLLTQAAAGRIAQVSRTTMLDWVRNGRVRKFEYPLLGMSGVAAVDVRKIVEERRRERLRREDAAKAQGELLEGSGERV